MIVYLIKSAFCLTLLLAVYHLFLEKENIHKFKRWYLLVSLIFSLAAPLITINVAVQQQAIPDIAALANFHTDPTDNMTIYPGTTVIITQPEGLIFTDYLLIAYLAVAGILLARFIINLVAILLKASRNENIRGDGNTLVLVADSNIPNSFLNYIFVNETDHRNGTIEQEMLVHERVHVRQKHSLDILFIELLKTVFWFNPVLILYKKAIQLNHEFLADEGVIRADTDVKTYQTLLLTKAGLYSNYALTSNFNYSVTKKRLIMMKTSTTKLTAALKELALLPLLLVLTFVLCIKAEAQQPQTKPVKAEQAKPILIEEPVVLYADRFPLDSVFIHYYNKKDGVKSVKPLSALPVNERRKYLMWAKKFPMTAKRTPTSTQFESWKDASTYGVWLDGKHIKNDVLNNYKATDFVLYYNSKLYGPAKKGRVYSYQIDLYTPPYYKKTKEEMDANNNKRTHTDIFAMVK